MKKIFRTLAKPITAPVTAVKDAIWLARVGKKVVALRHLFQGATASYERSHDVSKSLFASKAFWWNVLTVIIELVNLLPIPAPATTLINGVINVLLRFVSTKVPVHMVPGEEAAWAADVVSKQWFRSRTFWWNVVVAGTDIALALGDAQLIAPGTLTMINALGNILLRLVTRTAVHR